MYRNLTSGGRGTNTGGTGRNHGKRVPSPMPCVASKRMVEDYYVVVERVVGTAVRIRAQNPQRAIEEAQRMVRTGTLKFNGKLDEEVRYRAKKCQIQSFDC